MTWLGIPDDELADDEPDNPCPACDGTGRYFIRGHGAAGSEYGICGDCDGSGLE